VLDSMTPWGVILFWVLLGLAVAQVLIAIPLIGVLRRVQSAGKGAAPCPKTAVILCLRGSDPFLSTCLEGILHQDYPRYDVRIVIDSPDDPAWETVAQAVARSGRTDVRVRPLTERRPTCSLKCSSLLQAVSELDTSYEVIALLDADTTPHRTWLRELVAPLADVRVAAATGNRWYMPASVSWGSLARWLWNAAAVVQMYWWRIPWGGTLAVKTSVLRQSDVLDRWARAFCEDTMLYDVLRRLGCRVAFVPSLIMINREDCCLAGFYRWVRRQLLTVRLYHPSWVFVVGHGLGTFTAQLACLIGLVASLSTGHGRAAGWLTAGLGVYWAIMGILLAVIEGSIRRVPAGRGESTAWLRIGTVARVLPAMLLTQGINVAALLSALFLRTVEWRGIRYDVQGPANIRMMEYRPYDGRDTPDAGGGSL
jgi:glycosyltransferase involved in cell wall biosynthesis